MRLDSIEIRRFSRQEEYTSGKNPEKENINGENLLIKGENRSGKTLTFNALRYAILGDPIGMSPGRGNAVEIGFTDGGRFFRGHPKALYEKGDGEEGDEIEAGEAQDAFRDDTGPVDILENFFLHSRIEMLPLENLLEKDRLDLIRRITNPKHQMLIKRHSEAFEHLDLWVAEDEHRLDQLEDHIDEVRSRVNSFESQERREQSVIDMGESGQLNEILQVLNEHQELEQRLDELFKRQEGIRQELQQLSNRQDRARSYEKEVNELIKDAVADFVCPACRSSVTGPEAETRLDNNRCPFCYRKKSIKELQTELEDKKESTEGLADELQDEIDELKEEREEIWEEIERVRSQQPELTDFKPHTKRRLDEYDGDIQAVVDEAEDEIQKVREKLEQRRTELEELESEKDALEERLEELKESKDFALGTFEEYEDKSFNEAIEEFAEDWTSVLKAISTDIGQQIWITDEGEIYLPGSPSDRAYSGEELSESERKLLNISFAITLQNYVNGELVPLNTIVLDEPSNHLDPANTEDLLDYMMQDDERQYVFTSSNEDIWNEVPERQTLDLERNPIQTELTDFP